MQEKSNISEKDLPLVSVIIPTYNRKKQLISCIESLENSDYANVEIIVVDDAGTEITEGLCGDKKNVAYYKNKVRKFLVITRNYGAAIAKGDYLMFIDDDNVVDEKMISELVNVFKKTKKTGVVGPLMVYLKEPTKIWWQQTIIKRPSALTQFPLRNKQVDEIKNELVETEGIPNAFMVSKKIFDEVGGFDEEYLGTWTESDFCTQVKNLGYKVLRSSKALTKHDLESKDWNGVTKRSLGDSKIKAYCTIRNRYLFAKKHFSIIEQSVFLIIFSTPIALYYLFVAVKNRSYKLCRQYLKGAVDGVKIFLFYKQ